MAIDPWLAGDNPPKWFYDDGCSGAPDKIFGVNLKPLCRLHDYGYYEARVIDWIINGTYAVQDGKLRRQINGLRHDLIGPHLSGRDRDRVRGEISVLRSKIMHVRTTADINFRTNIRTLFRVAGKRWLGKVVASVYFRGVLRFGRRAVVGPGHAANFDALRAEASAYRKALMARWAREDRAREKEAA